MAESELPVSEELWNEIGEEIEKMGEGDSGEVLCEILDWSLTNIQ